MQHFFDAELASVDGAALEFTQEMADTYREPSELRRLDGRVLKKVTADALRKVKALPFTP